MEEVLGKVLEALGSREAASSEHGAIPFAADDLRRLKDLHEMLQQKFSSDLEFIRNRTDERK